LVVLKIVCQCWSGINIYAINHNYFSKMYDKFWKNYWIIFNAVFGKTNSESIGIVRIGFAYPYSRIVIYNNWRFVIDWYEDNFYYLIFFMLCNLVFLLGFHLFWYSFFYYGPEFIFVEVIKSTVIRIMFIFVTYGTFTIFSFIDWEFWLINIFGLVKIFEIFRIFKFWMRISGDWFWLFNFFVVWKYDFRNNIFNIFAAFIPIGFVP